MRKLKAWTGRVWIVMTARKAQHKGFMLPRREAREIRADRDHPKVKEVLQHFPRCTHQRRFHPRKAGRRRGKPSDVGEGRTEFKEDGTNS